MMKRTLFTALSLCLCLLLLLTGVACSSKNAGGSYRDESIREDADMEMENTAAGSATDKAGTDENPSVQGRKIIRNLEISVQTKEFAKLLEKLEQEVGKLEGYIQESNTNGLDPESRQYRSAYLVIRIPVEKSGNFDQFLTDNSVVT
ncbi:MAG: DUF4349 domain-containing protein, partial [Clostridia bacterium]|nr:DUF4349 domain-containing protein [Clostridia bacterium]